MLQRGIGTDDGSQQSVGNYIDSLTTLAPFVITKIGEKKKIIVKRVGN